MGRVVQLPVPGRFRVGSRPLRSRDSVPAVPTVRVAVFDLGSSSFHLMVVDACRDGRLDPVLRRRSFLHLGTEVARTGGVPGDRSALAVRTVKRLHAAAEDAGADVVVAMATAALRDADNGERLILRMERVLGSPITLLSGEEEARLCFLGQRGGVWVGADPVLGLDLGGGSLEAGIGTVDAVSGRPAWPWARPGSGASSTRAIGCRPGSAPPSPS